MINWNKLIKDTKFDNGKLQIEASIESDSLLRLSMVGVTCSVKGTPIRLDYRISLLDTDDIEEARQYILHNFECFIIHELHEMLKINGQKIPDKHHKPGTNFINNILPPPNNTWEDRLMKKGVDILNKTYKDL